MLNIILRKAHLSDINPSYMDRGLWGRTSRVFFCEKYLKSLPSAKFYLLNKRTIKNM